MKDVYLREGKSQSEFIVSFFFFPLKSTILKFFLWEKKEHLVDTKSNEKSLALH